MTRTFQIKTIGCKVNQYESRALAEELERAGLEESPDAADIVVVNTCTVTHRSDSDARALIRRARRANPAAFIAVTGCYARMAPDELHGLGVDLVVDTAQKSRLPQLILSGTQGVFAGEPIPGAPLEAEPVVNFGERSRAYLKVQEGCNVFCTYCIVPHARGPSRSLPAEEVAAGLARLFEGGHREVVLTGIHLGFWGRDLAPSRDFTDLIDIAEASPVGRVRLSSLEPLEVSDAVVERMKRSDTLCPHLHIPLQSGSDTVLKRMGRPYTSTQFRQRVQYAASQIEGLCLGFDVIVGFPGETDEEFEQTFGLLESLRPAYLHVFPFSPREGTPAFSMEEQVDPQVVKERSRRLRELAGASGRAFYQSMIGRKMTVLAEARHDCGLLKVRGRNYVEALVECEGEIPDTEFRVEVVGWQGDSLLAVAEERPC